MHQVPLLQATVSSIEIKLTVKYRKSLQQEYKTFYCLKITQKNDEKCMCIIDYKGRDFHEISKFNCAQAPVCNSMHICDVAIWRCGFC